MRISEVVAINNVKGVGAVPLNQEIDYFGLRVLMKPSKFLKLAATINPQDAAQQVGVVQKLMKKHGMGAPFLQIDIPDGWEEGDFSNAAKIVGHDGRHRMLSVLQTDGDVPTETHLFFPGLRRRNITPEMVKELNTAMVREKTQIREPGPFFTLVQ